MGLFNTGINILHMNSEKQTVEKFVFGSFDNRDMAFKRILALWKNRAPEEVWRSNKSIVSGDVSEHEYKSKNLNGDISEKEMTHQMYSASENEAKITNKASFVSSKQTKGD